VNIKQNITFKLRSPLSELLEIVTRLTRHIFQGHHTVPFLLTIAGMLLAAFTTAVLAATAPEQPQEGPGGADYIHDKIISSVHGSGDLKYYLFEPDAPKPDTAPLIIFIHGWGWVTPHTYGGWIEHLVRRGNVVVYPVYQALDSMFIGLNYTSNCIQSTLRAIKLLQSECHVRPALDRLAVVGHSVGGVLAPNVAARARQSDLAIPKAVMSIEPGVAPTPPMEDLSLIPSDTLLLVMVGDLDAIPRADSLRIFCRTSQIPLDNKDYITLVSDNHGQPLLIADHFAPTCFAKDAEIAPGFGMDTLDYYGTWKLFDALIDAAFYGKNREYALGNTPEQRYMGKWSDGIPVRELLVTDDPQPLYDKNHLSEKDP
jgi:acetyl esterase/lipase